LWASKVPAFPLAISLAMLCPVPCQLFQVSENQDKKNFD
jgi:hypothetical protein